MSLTKEDLIAISDLIDSKLNEQEKRLDKRFDQIDNRFEQIDNRFEQMDRRFVQIDNRFEQIDRRFVQIDNRLEQVDKRFEQIDIRFEQSDKKSKQIDDRFGQMEKHFDEKLDKLRDDITEIIENNNVLIAEHVQRVVSESEERLLEQIREIRTVTADNCYNIVKLNNKIS